MTFQVLLSLQVSSFFLGGGGHTSNPDILWGNLSGQAFFFFFFFFWGGGGTEQMLGPSLCSSRKSEYLGHYPYPSLEFEYYFR